MKEYDYKPSENPRDIKKIPSSRFFNSTFKSIKIILHYDQLTKYEQKILDDELNKIPLDNESIKQWILKNHLNKREQIIKETEKIIKQKEKLDDQYKKQNDPLKEQIGFFTDYRNLAEQFYKKQPYFYDKNQIWWVWNKQENKYEIIDDTDLMNHVDEAINERINTTISKTKNEIIESLKRVGRKKKPKESPLKWLQFKDKAFSLESKKVYDVEPNYFFTNPIPWKIGESSETPIINKLFTEWVGEKYVKTLYEIISYSCYTSYPIQIIICLQGDGNNGKSTFLKILSKFLGKNNICSTELDLLTGTGSSRFESFKLYKKLVCLMGETNFGTLSKSSLLKKLTGGDLIGYEMKGKKPFDDYNYSKLIIASNSLPISQDTSDGFYRRWIIINFSNKFKEGNDIFNIVPDSEYECLSKKVCDILPSLLELGEFTNQSSIEERKRRFVMESNPLPVFIRDCCDKGDKLFVSYNELYIAYVKYLKVYKKRRVNRKEFKEVLSEEGFYIEKSSKKLIEDGNADFKSGLWIDGLDVNDKFLDFLENLDTFQTQSSYKDIKLETWEKIQKKKNPYIITFDDRCLVNTYCNYPIGDSMCNTTPCNEYDGLHYCKVHFELVQHQISQKK